MRISPHGSRGEVLVGLDVVSAPAAAAGSTLPSRALRSPLQRRTPLGRRLKTAAAATEAATISAEEDEAEEEGLPACPDPPNTTEVMLRQASEAVMRAYRDGFTRQTVRLGVDMEFAGDEVLSEYGIKAYAKESTPVVESFAKQLWGGEYMKELKTSMMDEEAATLVYREAENPMMDAAVIYLPGRDLITKPKLFGFFEGMGDRLVVLSNIEQAASNWKVENMGRDFYLVGNEDAGLKVAQVFQEQTYYYYRSLNNNWQLTFFRVYPQPWKIYIEDLDYKTVQIGESETKPSFQQIADWMEEYEEKQGIVAYKKIGKTLKDQQKQGASDFADKNPFEQLKEMLNSENE